MARVMIRGIYSTSMGKLALDNGYDLVNPTWTQAQRLSLSQEHKAADLLIREYGGKHRVLLTGKSEVLVDLVELLKDRLPDVAIWTSQQNRGMVYPIVRRNVESRWEAIRVEGNLRPEAAVEIEVPLLAKQELDKIRNEVAYTVPGHHFCRAGSEALSNLVTFAEKLVIDGYMSKDVVSQLFSSTMSSFAPRKGELVGIEHVKLDGRTVILTAGKVVRRGKGSVVLRRTFSGRGRYDGLGTEIGAGDYGLTAINQGNWFVASQYYGPDHSYKGGHYSICTPTQLYENYATYVDLGIDVIDKPNGEPEIIDQDDLESAYEREVISQWLRERAIEEAETLHHSLEERKQELPR
ncbi:MAG: DUF402 domain-containing protein [Aigarchaeota archaeon]|nr:DUF402 domain-containing protein [Aigarchaeota archaeon]